MKKVYIIGGTMGVGKTTVCQYLNKELEKSVFLDGDWCWNAIPFVVTDETKEMVMDNITHVLNNFIHCSAYENILFCWVMHEQYIIDELVSRLETQDCKVIVVSLTITEEALTQHWEKDRERQLRAPGVLPQSVARIPLYEKLNTKKIEVTGKSVVEVAKEIREI